MSISKKIIEGNNQPSEGNAVVGGGGARALNPSEFIDPNHVLSVDASGQLITDINNSLDTRLFRGKGLVGLYPNSVAAYSLRSLRGVNGGQYVVRLRRASDNEEKDFSEADLTGSSVVGSQVILNPEFDSATGWATTGGWSITGGQAVNSGTNGNLQQGSRVTVGNYYIATLEIVACSNFDDLRLRFGAASAYSLSGIGITTTGTYQIAFQAQSTFFLMQTRNSATATIEFAGCEEYTPTAAELWTVEGIGNTTQLFAYSTTWYDQSGSGNDATQATAAAQPLLVRAGVTEKENGKPAMVFDGTDDYLDSAFTLGSLASIAVVYDKGVGVVNEYVLDGYGNADRNSIFHFNSTGGARLYNTASGINATSAVSQDQVLTFAIANGASSSIRENGNTEVTGSIGTGDMDGVTIGAAGSVAGFWSSSIQEIIVYPSDQSANRTNIETNINNHYNIY